ncbi:hypothetical protein BGX26_012695, partial [Mortierella sp. AD094]
MDAQSPVTLAAEILSGVFDHILESIAVEERHEEDGIKYEYTMFGTNSTPKQRDDLISGLEKASPAVTETAMAKFRLLVADDRLSQWSNTNTS